MSDIENLKAGSGLIDNSTGNVNPGGNAVTGE